VTKAVKIPVEAVAKRYLTDKIGAYLLGQGQNAKMGQIVKGIKVEGMTLRLLREVLVCDEAFACVDRRWTLAARFGQAGRPFERVAGELLRATGVPVPVSALAASLSQVYEIPAEVCEDKAGRFAPDLTKPRRFFAMDGKAYIAQWLVRPTSFDEDELLQDNDIAAEDIREFKSACSGLDWGAGYAAAAEKAVAKAHGALPIKVLGYYALMDMDEYDALEFYAEVSVCENLMLLSDQKLYEASMVKEFTPIIEKMAAEAAETPLPEGEEELEEPVVVTDMDKEEIVQVVLARGSASAEELLETVMEVSPGEAAYSGALESLDQALRQDERVMWVGDGRWSVRIAFPDEVQYIPDALVVPQVPPFETPEGDIFDQEIEEDGFEGDLKSAIYNPLAEDVTDEDPARTLYQEGGDSQRCVLKYHHKIDGTFPLCQISPDYFGQEPEIIPITLMQEGLRRTIYVNNSTRLIYGLQDFYQMISDVSGAVFHIDKTPRAGEYRFRYEGECDDQIGIDTSRSLELLDLRDRFATTEMAVYDAIAEILLRKQSTFPRLVTEVNIVRRCSRMLIASILSSYSCFSTKGKTGLWQYDEKKADQGFSKTKKKYIKK
jgi:hypothetical protein